jgi:hypothetical protein
VQAGLVVFPGELDGLYGPSAQHGIYEGQNNGVAISRIPFGSSEIESRRGFFQWVLPIAERGIRSLDRESVDSFMLALQTQAASELKN